MNSKTLWLLVVIVGAAGLRADAGTDTNDPVKIRVIQPKTDRLVYNAEVSILTSATEPVRIRTGRTGLGGEPFYADRKEELSPSLGQLVVAAGKRARSGATKISYDTKLRAWQQPFYYEFDEERQDWRRVVHDPQTGTWQLLAHDDATGKWTLYGFYEPNRERSEVTGLDRNYWRLRFLEPKTGQWMIRAVYETEDVNYETGTVIWRMTSFFDREEGRWNVDDVPRTDKENWRLPVNIVTPRPIKILIREPSGAGLAATPAAGPPIVVRTLECCVPCGCCGPMWHYVLRPGCGCHP